jgi:hypothetical protein
MTEFPRLCNKGRVAESLVKHYGLENPVWLDFSLAIGEKKGSQACRKPDLSLAKEAALVSPVPANHSRKRAIS